MATGGFQVMMGVIGPTATVKSSVATGSTPLSALMVKGWSLPMADRGGVPLSSPVLDRVSQEGRVPAETEKRVAVGTGVLVVGTWYELAVLPVKVVDPKLARVGAVPGGSSTAPIEQRLVPAAGRGEPVPRWSVLPVAHSVPAAVEVSGGMTRPAGLPALGRTVWVDPPLSPRFPRLPSRVAEPLMLGALSAQLPSSSM